MVAKTLAMPIFIAHGSRDYQVIDKDIDGWKTGLTGKTNATFKEYPKLNHTFVEGEAKATPADYDKDGHVAEELITDLAAWIKSLK